MPHRGTEKPPKTAEKRRSADKNLSVRLPNHLNPAFCNGPIKGEEAITPPQRPNFDTRQGRARPRRRSAARHCGLRTATRRRRVRLASRPLVRRRYRAWLAERGAARGRPCARRAVRRAALQLRHRGRAADPIRGTWLLSRRGRDMARPVARQHWRHPRARRRRRRHHADYAMGRRRDRARPHDLSPRSRGRAASDRRGPASRRPLARLREPRLDAHVTFYRYCELLAQITAESRLLPVALAYCRA